MKTWFKISILAKITKLLGILNANIYFWICQRFFLSNNSIGAKDWELSGNKLGVSGNKLRVMSLQIKFHESTNQIWVYNCEPTIRWSENPASLLKGLPCFIFAPALVRSSSHSLVYQWCTLRTHKYWHPPWQLWNALTPKQAGLVWIFF